MSQRAKTGQRLPVQAVGLYGWDAAQWVKIVTSTGAFNVNIDQWGGTAVTGDDITLRFYALNDDTVAGLFRSIGDTGATPLNATGETVLYKLEQVVVASGSSATDLTAILNTLGDAGVTPTDVAGETLLYKADRVANSVDDDTVKGLLRSIGDAGATPTNVTGNTVLQLLADIITALGSLPATQWNPMTSGIQTGTIVANAVASLDTGLLGGRLIVTMFASNPTSACTVQLEGSADNSNWWLLGQADILAGGGQDAVNVFNACRYLRANITAISGDTTSLEIVASR